MKSFLLPFIASALVFLTACSGPSYKPFNYQYQAPAEYQDLGPEHRTIAIKLSGDELGRPLTEFKHPLAPLQWTDQYQQADILVSLSVEDTKVYKDVLNENVDEIINSNGKKERTTTYVYPGVIQTAFNVSITDTKLNKSVTQLDTKYETPVSGSPQRSESAAESSLALTARVKKPDSRKDALASIHSQLTRLLEVMFTEHTKEMRFEIPHADDDEPRLANAFAILNTKPNKEGAREALAIYQAIGTQNKDKDGNDNKALNQGVHAGLAACYYILGDLSAYEKHFALAERDSWIKTSVTTSSDF